MTIKTAQVCRLLDAAVVIFLLLIDQLTKYLALVYIGIGKSLLLGSVGGISFSLTLTTNKGAAWGMFTEHPWLLLGVRLFFILLIFFFYLRSSFSRFSHVALLFIFAGAFGNIIDSFLLGYVVDMVHVVFWGWDYPVFNFADACIFLGCFGIFWESVKKEA